MHGKNNYTPFQLGVLILLWFLIGWHLLYEGFSKLLDSNWSSSSFLLESKWILANFFQWFVANDKLLNIVDFLNIWGLIAIGLGLILGIFTRIASISGAILLLIYYLINPPLIRMDYYVPSEGECLIINKTLIESVALFVLVFFPTNSVFGVDAFLLRYFKNKKNDREVK
jgi:thiosulfate dehydrogenase [quinone] large subunit